MTQKILLISFLFMLFFIGCSSTYRLTDFSTKENFYADFNKTVINKNINVALINDSTFSALSGSKIVNDTLYLILNRQNEKHLMPVSDIKKIRYYYTGYSTPSADIALKNGNEIKGGNVKVLDDSFIEYTIKKINSIAIPVSRVKIVSYKNRWLGALIGIPAGTVAGWGLGAFASGYEYDNNSDQGGVIWGYFALSGPVIGAVLGSIIGYTYTYQFNP